MSPFGCNFGFPHGKMCLQCSLSSAVLFPMHMTLVRKKIKASATGGRTEERYSCSTADAVCKKCGIMFVSLDLLLKMRAVRFFLFFTYMLMMKVDVHEQLNFRGHNSANELAQ